MAADAAFVGVLAERTAVVPEVLPYRPGESRGNSVRPLFVTAAGMPRTDAADLVLHMAGRFRLPDALRRADTLARTGGPIGTQSR